MRKSGVAGIFLPLMVGMVGLGNVMGHDRFAGIRSVDVVQLLGSGVCFGVAIMSFFVLWLGPKRVAPSEAKSQ